MAKRRSITLEDLETFRKSLLDSLTAFLAKRQGLSSRQWLKSHEVRRVLRVSPNTLQHLREKGFLPYTRIGGVIYYNIDDLHRMLENNKSNAPDVHSANTPSVRVIKNDRS